MYLSTFCISSREYISFSKFILPVDDISEKSLLTKDNAATIDSLGMYILPDIAHPFHIEISLYPIFIKILVILLISQKDYYDS